VTLALGTRLVSNGGGGSVTPIDPPILRRDLLQEDDFFIYCEDGSASKIVITFGTYDRMALEGGVDLLLTEASDKFILTVN
jgi:hypothetical protein